MDIKCKNCGQMIDENDKYCRYCGYLIPQKEKEVPLSKKALEDKLQEYKATLTEEEVEGSQNWCLTNLSVLKVGDKKSLLSKSVCLTVFLSLLGIVFLVSAILSKLLITNNVIALICLLIFMFSMLATFGFALERYYTTKGLRDLQPDEIVVRKYGFKKPAEILIDGYVFELVISKQCPDCEGEIIGDLHIERIEKKLVVVCNINRKHCYQIDEKLFIEKLRNGNIVVLQNSKMNNKSKNK